MIVYVCSLSLSLSLSLSPPSLSRDQLHVIDWKTSIKPKPTLDDLYDYPLQTVAYAGAINNDSRYPFKVMWVELCMMGGCYTYMCISVLQLGRIGSPW